MSAIPHMSKLLVNISATALVTAFLMRQSLGRAYPGTKQFGIIARSPISGD